jgi:cyanate permease
VADAGTAFAVMCLGAAVDVAFVWWARCTQRLDLWGTVTAAAAIQICGIVGLLFIVNDPTLLVANVAGHAVGSGIGIAMARRAKGDSND